MLADCHIHMLLDGGYYKTAIDRHREAPDEAFVRETLKTYQDMGYTFLRDGGDRFGAGVLARGLAGEYGIDYRSPLFPIYKKGRYGAFIGKGYETLGEYRALLGEVRQGRGDFVKLMVSGLMDFDHYGTLTSQTLERQELGELIHIAHEEGFAVMVHANGAEAISWAAEAGADSVEHGAYLNEESLFAMKEAGTVWVPTLSTVGNLLGDGRYPGAEVEKILASALSNVKRFGAMGGLLAPGSDAGAYRVFHGQGGLTERQLLEKALGSDTESCLAKGIKAVQERFRFPA